MRAFFISYSPSSATAFTSKATAAEKNLQDSLSCCIDPAA
jgi:hypothetical protein